MSKTLVKCLYVNKSQHIIRIFGGHHILAEKVQLLLRIARRTYLLMNAVYGGKLNIAVFRNIYIIYRCVYLAHGLNYLHSLRKRFV